MVKVKKMSGQSRVRLLSSLGLCGVAICAVLLAAVQACAKTDALPSWNDGPAKQAIIRFVQAAINESGPKYIAPKDRVASFDQDGTLWVEHPLYTQAIFALDRVKALASDHPEWKTTEPFKSVLADNNAAMAKFGEQDWAHVIAATHAGMSTETFIDIARQWLATARHPRFKCPYTDLVYQPMLEVMDYLRAHGFKTYIVTGGGQEFVRVYSEGVYGIPLEQVVGSSIATKYEYRDGKPVLLRLPKVFFIDDHAGKPVGINLFIGKRPAAAFGNSTGDQQMLEWTGAGDGVRLMMLVYHDDAEREYAYGPAGKLPDTKVGTFSEALMTEAKKKGWNIISMKKDWKVIFPFEKK
ncbi:MAG: haloacid dehalogenase-like hydrolase [Desulfobacterales bacterium]|nr:haloacid dehalogenase-like hydrolase [Desulfobacterales bacterium]